MNTLLRSRMDLPVDPATAFDQVVEDLAAGLERCKLGVVWGPEGGITDGADAVARIVSWRPGEHIALAWGDANSADDGAEVELVFRSTVSGTEVTFEIRNWAAPMGPWADVPGWFASHIAAPLLHALTPAVLGDWITDRVARRPSGRQARATYRDPLYHYPNFRVILDELSPGPEDVLLEVACGGGALLREGLKSGCRAAAVDHSAEMVHLARDANRAAVAEGRLQVVQADAANLPFAADMFTRAAMTGVLGFLPDPVAALAEIRRTLRPGGRLVALGSDPGLRGTPAAPEPIASRLRFYEDDDLERLGLAAGFRHAAVIRRDLEAHAREAGVPEEHLPLFAGLTSFLTATRS